MAGDLGFFFHSSGHKYPWDMMKMKWMVFGRSAFYCILSGLRKLELEAVNERGVDG